MVLILMDKKGQGKRIFEGVMRGSFSARNPPLKHIRHI